MKIGYIGVKLRSVIVFSKFFFYLLYRNVFRRLFYVWEIWDKEI